MIVKRILLLYRHGRLRAGLAVLAASVPACEPSPPPGDIGMLDVRTPQFTSDGIAQCLHCHAGSFNHSIEAVPHGDAANPGTPYAQHGCESCHGPGSFHVSRAHGGEGVPGMTNFGFGPDASSREEQLAACQSCHNPEASGSAAIAFTGSAHDSPFTNCSTCHTVHAEVESLSDPVAQAEVCFTCHKSQRENHVKLRGRTLNFSERACSRCHTIH